LEFDVSLMLFSFELSNIFPSSNNNYLCSLYLETSITLVLSLFFSNHSEIKSI